MIESFGTLGAQYKYKRQRSLSVNNHNHPISDSGEYFP